MATTQEMLDKVNDAIYALMNGGAVLSYSIGGRNLQHYSLKELVDLRGILQNETASQKGTRNYASFRRPL